MKGYKVTDSNYKCRGFEFKVGKTYTHKGDIVLCQSGFHFCKQANNCFNYYNFDKNNHVFEIEAKGDILGIDSDKQVTNKIKIVKELTWFEVLGLVNIGSGNTGKRNSGDSNSGDSNSGDSNSRNFNSGNSNSGDFNSGNSNSGNFNSGDSNSGEFNSGNSNSDNFNSGNSNSGNFNSGNSNSGDFNSGDSNSGNSNSGDFNSGDSNSGNFNSGDYNLCNNENGYLNSKQSDYIRVFNKRCKRNKWNNATLPDFFSIKLNIFIHKYNMTDQEKIDNPDYETTHGYLKRLTYQEAWAESFKTATEKDIKLLKALPNFDAKVFYEITGIRIK